MNENVVNAENLAPLSPGKMLSAERNKQNLTEREVADRLKITMSKLRDLEKDKYQSFPAKLYLRGYLKNYARLLNLSENSIIESYEFHVGDSDDEEPPMFAQESAPASPSRKGFLALVIAGACAIVLVMLLTQPATTPTDDAAAQLFEQANEEPPVASPLDTLVIEAPAEDAPLAVDELIADETDATDNGIATEASDIIEVSEETVEMLASKLTAVELMNLANPEVEQPLVQAEAVSLIDVLDFRFVAQCWIEVRDSAGSLLYSGLENAGSERQIEGEAPFQVVIGNVEGAELSINGESVLLQSPRNGRALRLEVGS